MERCHEYGMIDFLNSNVKLDKMYSMQFFSLCLSFRASTGVGGLAQANKAVSVAGTSHP